jgi:hypothetical protein
LAFEKVDAVGDAEHALERHADLIEIVAMARVLMAAAIAPERQAEIIGRSFLAGKQELRCKSAAAMLFLPADKFHPAAVDELHGDATFTGTKCVE